MPAPPLRQLRANGVELAFVDEGAGEPVVFVHGACGDWRTFDVLRPLAARRARYVAYSRRYHQPNPWPDDGSDYSYPLHAADLIAFIEALDAGPVHLVGHSYGAGVVLLAILDRPGLVRRAVVNEAGSLFPKLIEGRPDAAPILAERASAWGEMRTAAAAGDPERAAELLFDWISGEPGALRKSPAEQRRRWLENARTMSLMLAQPPPPPISCAALGAVHVPILVLRGERTVPFYAATNDALSACLPPGAAEAAVPAAGHLSYEQNPGAYADAVWAFLAREPAPART
ncbi:MAG TPA: alpha/beta hydrolase [Anaeromyxobacter sp.]|jgi:pimeloyl-ACP methyl ester carboxylesterase|nr:alpha/beta hydrolase [Anaeromyxobacter sp.]